MKAEVHLKSEENGSVHVEFRAKTAAEVATCLHFIIDMASEKTGLSVPELLDILYRGYLASRDMDLLDKNATRKLDVDGRDA